MAAPSSAAPEPVVLIIADISGYTRYMAANAKTLAHSQAIITELVKAIVHQIELPLEIAKLEGDAVFLYCCKQNASRPWEEVRRLIGQKLLGFFELFHAKVQELSRSTTCTCNACTHIERLRLKVIVHSGEALFHQVFNFLELAGVDVIVAHRLLKNSVAAEQYLLLTESAQEDVEFAGPVSLARSLENYEDIGRINTLVHVLESAHGAPMPRNLNTFGSRFGQAWRFSFKLWFAPLFLSSGQAGTSSTPAPTRLRHAGLAVFTLLLTPFYLPVGTVFILLHVLRQPTARGNLIAGQGDRTHVCTGKD